VDRRGRLVDARILGGRAAGGDEQDEDERKDESSDGRCLGDADGYLAVAVPVMFGWTAQTNVYCPAGMAGTS